LHGFGCLVYIICKEKQKKEIGYIYTFLPTFSQYQNIRQEWINPAQFISVGGRFVSVIICQEKEKKERETRISSCLSVTHGTTRYVNQTKPNLNSISARLTHILLLPPTSQDWCAVLPTQC